MVHGAPLQPHVDVETAAQLLEQQFSPLFHRLAPGPVVHRVPDVLEGRGLRLLPELHNDDGIVAEADGVRRIAFLQPPYRLLDRA